MPRTQKAPRSAAADPSLRGSGGPGRSGGRPGVACALQIAARRVTDTTIRRKSGAGRIDKNEKLQDRRYRPGTSPPDLWGRREHVSLLLYPRISHVPAAKQRESRALEARKHEGGHMRVVRPCEVVGCARAA